MHARAIAHGTMSGPKRQQTAVLLQPLTGNNVPAAEPQLSKEWAHKCLMQLLRKSVTGAAVLDDLSLMY
jgi:hypothetical protein